MIGPVEEYRNIYVCECGRQFPNSVLGREHERSCHVSVAITAEMAFADVVDSARCVVATAFGNVDGLDLQEQLMALRMASRSLQDALNALDSLSTSSSA